MRIGGLEVDDAALERLCRAHRVRSLALFGSRLRGEEGAGSDVDVLVEFEPGASVGLDFIRVQDDLSALFGRPVDLATPAFLSPHFRDRVLREATRFYEAA